MSGKAVRETLAALGVIASMVFVGMEIRQNTAVARGQTRQELAVLNQEWLILLTTDTEFSDFFGRAWGQTPNLAEAEVRRARNMMVLNLRRLENVYLQYSEGLLDESALNSYGLAPRGIGYRTPHFADFWADDRRVFDPGFVEFFEALYDLAP
jgi:hypothetical protein